MKVFFPNGGKFLMFNWWSYNEGSHIILAHNEASMNSTALRIFNEYNEVEIKEYCEIEIVGPPIKFSQAAADFDRQQHINIFHMNISYRLSQAVELGLTLPPMFKVCDTYEFKYDDDYISNEVDEYHTYCKCIEKIRLVNLTPEELFNKYHETWYELTGYDYYYDDNPKHIISKAIPATDCESLWFAAARFGDHSDGILIQKVHLDDEDNVNRPSYLSNNVMFFFRKVQELDKTLLQAGIDKIKALDKARQKLEEKSRRDKRKKENLSEAKEVIDFFNVF